MASTDTTPAQDAGSVEAGLDALETTTTGRTSLRRTLVDKVLPPVIAIAVVLVVWQGLISFKIVDDPSKLPSPADVWHVLRQSWLEGTLLDYIWTSVSRGLLGFCLALLIGTPLGLLVARVKFVRAALGPILSGLQSLPSVAWVPPAVIWLGLNNSMMY
ncbi:ABC transporter permease, partial [Streptomyces sp. NPDC001139]